MFDGDQFRQFIASSRTSLPIPLSFPLHGNPSFSAAFDPYPFHGQLHHQEPPPTTAAKNNNEKYPLISTNLGLESERSVDPWSNDEVLALLKVRSSMEIWFPDFTWEHVSRKLGELGYRRSADHCKEKFEEESRHLNSKSCRILSELDEFYTADDHQDEARNPAEKNQILGKTNQGEQENSGVKNPCQESEKVAKKPEKSSKKKKRKDKLEMFKGFCETVVSRMMAQQEELHNKLIEDIVKRDDEKIAREEAWKSQEMDRIKMEIQIRAKEQATAAERQATIIELLKKFTSDDEKDQNLKNKIDHYLLKVNSSTNASSISCNAPHENPPPSSPKNSTPNTSLLTSSDHNQTLESPKNYETGSDVGKRWPRDEVLALINLRCKMNNGNGGSKDAIKGPLWERISKAMMELGYERSAKRCKEKWENINKYFRKTKDSSKKRSVNSRTCPYFHELSCLYSEGTIVGSDNMQEN